MRDFSHNRLKQSSNQCLCVIKMTHNLSFSAFWSFAKPSDMRSLRAVDLLRMIDVPSVEFVSAYA